MAKHTFSRLIEIDLFEEYERQQKVYEELAKKANVHKEDIESYFNEMYGAKATFCSTKKKDPNASNYFIAKEMEGGKATYKESREKYAKLDEKEKKAWKAKAVKAAENEYKANRGYNMELVAESISKIMDVAYHEGKTESVYVSYTAVNGQISRTALYKGGNPKAVAPLLEEGSFMDKKLMPLMIPAGYHQQENSIKKGTPPEVQKINNFRSSVNGKVHGQLVRQGFIREDETIPWKKLRSSEGALKVRNWPENVPFKTVSSVSAGAARELDDAFNNGAEPEFYKE